MTYRVFARRRNRKRTEMLADCRNVTEKDLPTVLAAFRYEHPASDTDIYYQCGDGEAVKYEAETTNY